MPTGWIALVQFSYTSPLKSLPTKLYICRHICSDGHMNWWFGLQDVPVIYFTNVNKCVIPTTENVGGQAFVAGSRLMLYNSYYTCLIAILFDNGMGFP